MGIIVITSRVRRLSVWVDDYTSGEDLSDTGDEVNMVMMVVFMVIFDLINFNEVIRYL